MPDLTLTFALTPTRAGIWCQHCSIRMSTVRGSARAFPGTLKVYLCDTCTETLINQKEQAT